MASSAKSSSTNGHISKSDLSLEDLSKQIEILKSDISSLTSTLGEYAKSKGAEATDTAKAKAQKVAETGRDKAVEAQLHAEEFIRTKPATALGIAAGLGFLIGMITSRR